MSAPSVFDTLITRLGKTPKNSLQRKILYVADENSADQAPLFSPYLGELSVITNRFDIAETYEQLGVNTQFSDYDFSCIQDGSVDIIIYRVSKERSVSHHVLNQCQRLLNQNGILLLGGKKDEGIKTYFKACKNVLGFSGELKKDKSVYTCELRLTKDKLEVDSYLQDNEYDTLRPVIDIGDFHFFSKPGIYGWNKIDQGSKLLAECLQAQEIGFSTSQSAVDLGCGYGYLAIEAIKLGVSRLVATDNNAAAVAATQINISTFNAQNEYIRADAYEVVASDCGQNIAEKFDLVLCNPPFHQGFDTSKALTEKFVAAARRLVRTGGSAIFVVNAFIPIESVSAKHFSKVELLINNKQFKVVKLIL